MYYRLIFNRTGIRQGCVLSPALLFNVLIDYLIEDNIGGGKLKDSFSEDLKCMDDIALPGIDQLMLEELQTTADSMGLQINGYKTKALHAS